MRRLLFKRFCESDRVNLARMRARFTGGDVEAAVASVSPAAAAWHRRGRKVKAWLDGVRGKRR
jgi:predicted ATPase